MNHPGAQLDDKRIRLIRDALKLGYTVEQCKAAVYGCSVTPHNMGENDRNTRFDGIHIIFGNADQIDRFIKNSKNPPKKQNRQERQEASNAAALEGFVNGASDAGR